MRPPAHPPHTHSALWEDSYRPAVGLELETGLDAYRYVALPPDAPERSALRSAYLRSLSRHQAIRSRLAPLIAAWSEQGIEALVFKGFHLSEFVYPTPGARLHGDVDILLRPEKVGIARDIAVSLGWLEGLSAARLGLPTHECLTLLHSDAPVLLDIHDRVVHVRGRVHRSQATVTEGVWRRSSLVDWQGTRLRLPSPADAFLVLALNRAWADRGRLKAHDPIDATLLAADISLADVRHCAADAGCSRSLEVFLRCCDPWSDRVPRSRRGWKRLVDSLLMMPERGWVDGELSIREVARIPRRLAWAIRSLPTILQVRHVLRKESDLRTVLARLVPAPVPNRTMSTSEQFWRVGGVRWALRLLGGASSRSCLVRSLAVFKRLRGRGVPAVFVSGVRRTEEGALAGHAWVEVDGKVLPELKEWWNRRTYAVNVEFPS